jgi:hypothetical protein
VGRASVAVASGVRVREVADPKCRCPGTGRPRWMSQTPRGALPGSLAPGRGRRRRAAGRRRRTGGGAGSAWLRSGFSRRRVSAGSRRGRGCRCGAGRFRRCRDVAVAAVSGAGEPVADVLAAGGVEGGGAGRDAKWLRSGNRAMSRASARMRAAPAGPMPWMSIRCEPVAATAALSSAFMALSLASRRCRSSSSSAAIRRRVLPAGSRGRTVASSAWYWRVDFFTGAPPGSRSRNRRCSRPRAWLRARDSSSRRPPHPQHHQLRTGADLS